MAQWINAEDRSRWPTLRSKRDFVPVVVTDGSEVGMGLFCYRFDLDRDPSFTPIVRDRERIGLVTHFMPVYPLPITY